MANAAKITAVVVGAALLGVGGAWWVQSAMLDSPQPEHVALTPDATSVSRDDAPTTLTAPEAGDTTPRDTVTREEPAPKSPAQEATPGPWTVRVYAETDSGRGYSLHGSTVVATRTHPGRGPIAPVPEPHVAYGAGVWRPQGESSTASVLEIFEAAPLHASLVTGDTVMDTILLRGGEEEVVFVISQLLIEQSKGTITFQVVDVATGEAPTQDGFRIGARGIDPGPARIPFRRTDSGARITRGFVQGPYTLFLGGSYYCERRIEFDIVAGRRIDLGVIELLYTTGILGQVENPAGEILDIPVIARRSGQPAPVGVGDFKNFGDRFFLGSLPPGEIWVTVDAPDWACVPVRFEVQNSVLEDAVVPAYEGTPLTLERSQSARGRIRATILTAGGQVAWHGTLDVGERTTLRLVPGSYTLRTEPGGERTIAVAADAQRVEL